LSYEPGDHVGVLPMNKSELVDGILHKLTGVTDPDEDLQLEILNEKHTSNGKYGTILFFSTDVQQHTKLFLFVQASLERGRVTRRFQHVHCELC
jgi:sulfite reductase alpha subunit-like flavoprotein